MRFATPAWLGLLAAVAALAGVYVVLQRRRRHHAVRFTNLDLLAKVAPSRPGWRRHVPAAGMGLALVARGVALAGPSIERRVPKEQATVMLVIDTSASMLATDVAPNRLQSATAAAAEFAADLPARFQLGVVLFDRTARVAVTPTTDRTAVTQVLRSPTTGAGTAAGDAITAALDAIAGVDAAPDVPAAIVLLSDGASTVGRPVEEAATTAAGRHVPVSTIAFGTPTGTVDVRGNKTPVPADPKTMAEVAAATGGASFEAFTGDELRAVYDDIGSRVGYNLEWRDSSAWFMTAAVALLFASLAAALVWTGRIL
jgi:Ca-activated chloride channel family protein